MEKPSKIIVLFILYLSLSNVFDYTDVQGFDFLKNSNQLSFIDTDTQKPINDTYAFDNSAYDDCFDEYIVNSVQSSVSIKSGFYYSYISESPQTIHINIWHPPQNS